MSRFSENFGVPPFFVVAWSTNTITFATSDSESTTPTLRTVALTTAEVCSAGPGCPSVEAISLSKVAVYSFWYFGLR